MDSMFSLTLQPQFKHPVLIFSKHSQLLFLLQLLISSKPLMLQLFMRKAQPQLLIFSKHFLLLILQLQVRQQLEIFSKHFIEPLFKQPIEPQLLIFLKLFRPQVRLQSQIFEEHFQRQSRRLNEIFLMFKLQLYRLRLLISEGHFLLQCLLQSEIVSLLLRQRLFKLRFQLVTWIF